MINRHLEDLFEKSLVRFPAIALLGPRQVGKTTLAQGLMTKKSSPSSSVYLDLELPSDLAKLTDPEDYFERHQNKLIILDEIQRKPDLFPILRGVIDAQKRRAKGKEKGSFLLLGSASLDLLKQSSETLAGRLITIELTPFLVSEILSAGHSIDQLWIRGGFPDSFLAEDQEHSFQWRQAFIRSYLERDIPALNPRLPAETLRRFWIMLSHCQGTMVNHSTLANSLGVSSQTVARYLDLLVDLLLVRRLPPWSGNVLKRLVRSPKIYLRDSGLVHTLLGLKTEEDLLSHPIAGGSWEGFVIENILSSLPFGTETSYYRDSSGAEVDLILEFGRGERWAIEIKRGSFPSVARGFHTACDAIQATRRLVIYPGREAFSLKQNIEVLGLSQIITDLQDL